MKYEKCTYYILLVECACFANKQTKMVKDNIKDIKDRNFQNH